MPQPILIVDAETHRRSLLEKIVVLAHGLAVPVDNASDALEACQGASVAFVAADALGSGVGELLSNLKALNPQMEILVVASLATAQGQKNLDSVLEALHEGVADLVDPDIETREEVLGALDRALGRSLATQSERVFWEKLWDLNESFLKKMVQMEKRNLELEEKLTKERKSVRREGGGSLGPSKVLVVEDEEDVAVFMRDFLRASGYEVELAEDAHVGLKKFRANTPDIVVTDKNLPEMTGLELVQIIKEERSEIPVILVTGYASMESAIQAVDLGIFAYLQKPFRTKDLLAKIEEALSEKKEEAQAKNYLLRFKERNEEFLKAFKRIRSKLQSRLL